MTGRRFDYETALYYYRARYYDYYLGRFLQTDPLSYDDGLNLYSYCGNNPVVLIDPWGLCKDRSGLIPNLTGIVFHGSLFALASAAYQLQQLPPSPSFAEQAVTAPPWVQALARIADIAAFSASAVGQFGEATFGVSFEDTAIYQRDMARIHLASLDKRLGGPERRARRKQREAELEQMKKDLGKLIALLAINEINKERADKGLPPIDPSSLRYKNGEPLFP